MKCNFFIAAQGGIIDIQSKRVSAISIYEDTKFINFPTLIPVSVITVLNREENDPLENEVFLDVLLNDIHIIKEHRINLTFNNESRGIKSMTTFGGLILNNPGTLLFRLFDSKIEYGKFSINVESQQLNETTNYSPS